MFSWTI